MKGTKLCLIGVCFSLTGIALNTNNDAALAMSMLGLVAAFAGFFIKD